jgi:hypothetical protein
VVGVTTRGTPAKPDRATWRYNGTVTLKEAEARKALMERLNPGKAFVIMPRS